MKNCTAARCLRPRCFATVLAVKFIISVTIFFVYQVGRSGQFFRSPDLDMEYFVTVNGVRTAREAQRRLLGFDRGFSNSSKSSISNGIRAVLIHRPSVCSSSSTGENLSTDISVESQRVQELNCALQRSASRVQYLLAKKSRDRLTISYGLPTRYIPDPEDPVTEGRFVRETLRSPDWEDSYESESWSQPGEYLMKLQIGTPPRTLTGIVDTGSDLTWLQCRRCQSCYEQSDPIYEPNESSTYVELDCSAPECEDLSSSFCNAFSNTCDYLYSYGDRSYTYGTISTDTFTLRSTRGQAKAFPDIMFGCSHSSRGTFTTTRADGVVALGRGALSLASQLGKYFSDRFGYCLVSRWNPSTTMSPIYFGDMALLTGPGVGYTPILLNRVHPAFYYINMTGISVGGTPLDISPAAFAFTPAGRGGTILDSGTTVTNLGGVAYEALLASLKSTLPYPLISSRSLFELCFDTKGISDPRFPRLVFHLEGVDLDLPLENYVIEAEDNTLCLAVDRSSDSLTVIGNIQQQNFRVLYDRQNFRIGFQPAMCDDEQR